MITDDAPYSASYGGINHALYMLGNSPARPSPAIEPGGNWFYGKSYDNDIKHVAPSRMFIDDGYSWYGVICCCFPLQYKEIVSEVNIIL